MGKIDWNKSFPISYLTREDVVDSGIPRWQAAGLDNEQMTRIASRMEDMYADHSYHEDLLECIEFILLDHPIRSIIGGVSDHS